MKIKYPKIEKLIRCVTKSTKMVTIKGPFSLLTIMTNMFSSCFFFVSKVTSGKCRKSVSSTAISSMRWHGTVELIML